MNFDPRWKNPQGNSTDQISTWAQDLVKQLRSGKHLEGSGAEVNLLDFIPSNLHGSIQNFSITSDVQPYVQAAVNEAAGRTIRAPAGRYPLYSGVSYSGQINLVGDGNGCGPGPAAIANSGCTQFMLYFSSGDVFSVTSNFPSTFRDFQINTIPASRPRSSGAGILISGPSGSPGSTNANSKVLNVGMTEQFDCVRLVRPQYQEVAGCYFDTWVHAGVYASTTTSVEGSAGSIRNNFFFGTSGSTSQDSCVLLSCGYVRVSENLLLGAKYGVHISIDTFAAGAIRIWDNFIENQGANGIHASTSDGTLTSMVSIVRNEFSNNSFVSNWESSVTITDYSSGTDWISDIEIAHNVHRHTLNANHRFIWVQSGKTVVIRDEQLENLGTGSTTIGVDLSTSVAGALESPVWLGNIQYQGTFGSGRFLTTAVTEIRDTQAPVTKTADFTVASEAWLINNKAGSGCTVTLPSAATFIGRQIVIKTIQAQTVVSNASNVVPLVGGAAGTAILAATAGKWAMLVSNGTNWEIMAGN